MTRRCLASVSNSLLAAKISSHRIIMIDNGSSPATAREILENSAGDSVEIVRLETNQGFSRGMNAGLRAAFSKSDTDRVVLLSNDIVVPADFYVQLYGAEKREPLNSIWCPEVYFLSDVTKPAYTHGKLSLSDWKLSHHFESGRSEIVFPDYYPAAATIWGRDAFIELGGFNESYFCYWEDVELSWRCKKTGIKLIAANPLRVHHLGRGTTSGKARYARHFAEGRDLTMQIVYNRN